MDETKLALRSWRMSDAPALAALLQDPSVRRDLREGLPDPYTTDDARAFLTQVMASDPDKTFSFAITYNDVPVGNLGVLRQQNEFPERLFMIERKGKLGLGTAYITGFKWSIEKGYDYIFEMDADFSHNPNDLPRLYKACHEEGADVSIGSRYVSGVNVVNWPMGRVLMSYFASKYVRFITGLPIHDTTAGFVCYRRKVLETIHLDHIRFKGYAFQIEMKFTAFKCGFHITEVPVIFINRELGTSKMNSSIFGEAVFGVIQLKWDSWFKKYPKHTN